VTEVIIIGEGQTEETFVRDVLAPTLAAESVFLSRSGSESYDHLSRWCRGKVRR
jgi:hypothetical protein